jgi:hypothetical protein
MKIAILFPNNIATGPYVNYYTKVLDTSHVEYEVITWNRKGITEENTIAYNNKFKSQNPIMLALEYYRFCLFIKQQLKERQFDKVMVFSPQLGVFLVSFLCKYYPNKYILDIRDFTPVINYFPKKLKKLLLHSKHTFISSQGFLNWLPKDISYVLSHNVSIDLLNHYLEHKNVKVDFFGKDTIAVDTIGAIRDFQSNYEVINSLRNHNSFQMSFIGNGPAVPLLKEKTKDNNITNVRFTGAYKKSQEAALLKESDFLNIILDNNEASSHITANRLYLAALLNIPCIVRENTEQSRIVSKYKLGVIIDTYEEIPEKLLTYKENFHKEQFIDNCTVFLSDIKKDHDRFKMTVQTFITEI